MRPQDDPSWHAYGDTLLEFVPGADPLRVDLRQPVTKVVAERLAARGLAEAFVVIRRASRDVGSHETTE